MDPALHIHRQAGLPNLRGWLFIVAIGHPVANSAMEMRIMHGKSLRLHIASLLESAASFKSRALNHGLTNAQYLDLTGKGIGSLSKLAFAVTTPGMTPSEDSLRRLLNETSSDTVTLGDLSAIRRLMFDAQTLSVAMVKQAVESNDGQVKSELSPSERSHRVADQKTRPNGISFQGLYERSLSCYDILSEMLGKDTPSYLQPHRFGTRSAEVSREKPAKELVIDSGAHVAVRDAKQQVRCNIKNELEMSQAFTKKAVAFDLIGACTFAVMEKFH